VRLPLGKLTIAATDADQLAEFADAIRDEVNVKALELSTDVAAHGRFEMVVNARVAGPRVGKDIQAVIRAAKAGEWTTTPSGSVIAAGVELLAGEFERKLLSRGSGAAAELPAGSGLVLLDTVVTPELAAEGLARDLVRTVQQARRDRGLAVSDRIVLTINGPDVVIVAARRHEELIKSETLAVDISYASVSGGFRGKVGDGIEVTVLLQKD
jgi:isoleucyl-tRNA synthetase